MIPAGDFKQIFCLTYLDDDDDEEEEEDDDDDDDDPKSVISTDLVAMDLETTDRKQNGKVANYLQDAIS